MSLPFGIAVGDILHHGQCKIRFEADLGDGDLHFTNVRTAARHRVEDPETGKLGTTTVPWLLAAVKAGQIFHARSPRPTPSVRRGDLTGVDEDAADTLDPRSSWRKSWVREARAARVKCEPACKAFINLNYDRIADEYLARKGRKYQRPGASTLKKWICKTPVGFAPEAHVALAGRRKGQSQLTDAEDALVHEAALYFWSDKGASIVDAHAVMHRGWERLKDQNIERGEESPSYETVRLRIWTIATFATVLAKFGRERAEKMFDPVGEPIEVHRAFQRVFVDGTELEQVCLFGEDWQLPSGKMKCVAAMDAFSTFVFDPTIFAGPYREEMSIETLCRVMTPPDFLSDEQLGFHEFIGWTFAIPEEFVPDCDRTLIGPGLLPALLDLGSSLDLPEVYHSDAKAPLEWWFGWLKSRLKGLPGTVLSPRHSRDIKQDPVDGAEMVAGQLVHTVRALIWDYNTTPVERLNWRSPFEVLIASMIANGAATLDNPERIRAELEKTVNDRVLTDDGLENDGIQYRGPEVGGILRRNYHEVASSRDGHEPVTLKVSIRTNEANVDYIRVWDADAKSFVKLWSTQPTYTTLLSRWEHNEYRSMAKARSERFDTEGQRVRSRIRSLELIDEQAPKAAFRRRAKMFALAQAEEVRQRSGSRARRAGFLELPEHFVIVDTSTVMRGDPGRPPPGPKNEKGAGITPKRAVAPPRAANRGISPARQSHPDQATYNASGGVDWDALDEATPDDDDFEGED
jgi:putative transposase